jgi:glycosyltransferase involved in cell wall biosynthesis
MSLPRVCYLGAYDPDYPRNLILRRGLAHHSVEVVECRVSARLNTRQRAAALAPQFRAVADQCDVIILAEFNQTLAWFAGAMARRYRKGLVVDAFTPVYDSAVYDRAVVHPRTLAAWRYWFADYLTLHPPLFWPYTVIADTNQHRQYYIQAFGGRPGTISVIPVGASREWFEAESTPRGDGNVLVLFYGTYIPLHGIDTILNTAHLLRAQPHIRFELIGRGQTYAAMQALATELRLENVSFLESVPPAQLPGLVARADICLGIFGTTDKAQRVVPNKVYQALALGKAVISADTPALRDAFNPGEHLIATPPGDARALADAIAALAADPDRRRQLGAAGRTRMAAEFSEAILGPRLLEAMVWN